MVGKKFFRKFLDFVVVGIFAISSSGIAVGSAAAITEAQLHMFSQNNILFYDPTGGGVFCYSGNLSGDTIMAKVVNYLSGNNPTGFVLSENGIAGILANFQGESGFNPFRYQSDSVSGPAYGIAQFDPMSKIMEPLRTDSRTANVFNEYVDLKYTYFDPETGLPTEPVPMDVVDAWLSVQLDFFFGSSSEFENTKVGSYRNMGGTMGLDYISGDMTAHEAMDAARTPEDATRIFVWIMERPADKEGAANGRSQNAQRWLSYVRAMGSVGSDIGSSSSTSGENVTIIGDSITNGARSSLEQALPGIDIHAQDSKQFYNGDSSNPAGITILRDLVNNNQLRDILVFALGTNGNFTLEQAQEVVDLAGDSRKVIFVTNYTTSNDYSANNNTLMKVKNDNLGQVAIADWKAAIESEPNTYLGSDGIHPNAAGQELFASIIASTVSSSGSRQSVCVEGSVDGGLSEAQAQALADYYNGSEVDANYWGLPYGKKNCVSFSAFFIQRFTSVGLSHRAWGNGKEVANNLAQAENLPTGTEARPFAVFSVTRGSTVCNDGHLCGHTGIVVAVDGDQLITVEAAYQASDAQVHYRDISYFENTQFGDTFTYLDSILNQSELAQIVGN